MPSCTRPGGAIFHRISKCARLMRRRHQRGCTRCGIVGSARADATITASGCQSASVAHVRQQARTTSILMPSLFLLIGVFDHVDPYPLNPTVFCSSAPLCAGEPLVPI